MMKCLLTPAGRHFVAFCCRIWQEGVSHHDTSVQQFITEQNCRLSKALWQPLVAVEDPGRSYKVDLVVPATEKPVSAGDVNYVLIVVFGVKDG